MMAEERHNDQAPRQSARAKAARAYLFEVGAILLLILGCTLLGFAAGEVTEVIGSAPVREGLEKAAVRVGLLVGVGLFFVLLVMATLGRR
jgi:hypothetical protein